MRVHLLAVGALLAFPRLSKAWVCSQIQGSSTGCSSSISKKLCMQQHPHENRSSFNDAQRRIFQGGSTGCSSSNSKKLRMQQHHHQHEDHHGSFNDAQRRIFLVGGAATSLLGPSVVANAEVTRAVGSGEIACQEAGNCLETGEWDGAVGWHWGGKDRCDPTDPLCGPDGRLRDEILGKTVPKPVADITHAVSIQVDIGRDESGILRLGLYGNACPGSVNELIDFFSNGLSTLQSNENVMGAMTKPVELASGGVVDSIVPGKTISFGVASQANAFGRSRGMSKVDDSFVPQPRPDASLVANDSTIRSHDAAGLVSLSNKGLGYGGTGFESDDEAFESSFLVTASPVPALDNKRRVVGQVLDSGSMAFLERLSSLPTKKGLKGVIPGQTAGPPLLKVAVRAVAVSKVSNSPAPASTS